MAAALEGHMPAFSDQLADVDRSIVGVWVRAHAAGEVAPRDAPTARARADGAGVEDRSVVVRADVPAEPLDPSTKPAIAPSSGNERGRQDGVLAVRGR